MSQKVTSVIEDWAKVFPRPERIRVSPETMEQLKGFVDKLGMEMRPNPLPLIAWTGIPLVEDTTLDVLGIDWVMEISSTEFLIKPTGARSFRLEGDSFLYPLYKESLLSSFLRETPLVSLPTERRK